MKNSFKNNDISDEQVKHIANLIRLEIGEEEAVEFSRQFNQIIAYFEMLNEIDTDDVQPANEKPPTSFVYREDIIKSSIATDEFLRNAPDHSGQFIKIPRIFHDIT